MYISDSYIKFPISRRNCLFMNMIEEEIELFNLDKKANDIYEINTKDWVTKANTIIESQ